MQNVFKVKNEKNRTRFDFKHISHIFLVFVLLTLNKQMLTGMSVAIEGHPRDIQTFLISL